MGAFRDPNVDLPAATSMQLVPQLDEIYEIKAVVSDDLPIES